MGMIINIDKAVELRSDYNILKEPLNKMLMDEQEAWEKQNPIDMLFVRGSISSFQETYTSSIGFDHAFAETADYSTGPIFNTAEGFAATYRTRTFQGGFIITQQALEDRQVGKIKDDANAFIRRWHGDVVEYAMTAIDSGFGVARTYGEGSGASKILLKSADTKTGEITDEVKNPLFYKEHTTVKREGKEVIKQSNMFAADIDIKGSDAGKIAKLADVINYVITKMENYKNDNGKYAGVNGAKTIVTSNDPHLKAAIETALSMDVFHQGEVTALNPAYKRATLVTTPYLNDTECCKIVENKFAKGFFIVDKSYMENNHGLELTERIPLTLNVFDRKESPAGIKYEGRERFDINVATWRGIAYVSLQPSKTSTDWDYEGKFDVITPSSTIVKPVSVVGDVKTTA